MLGVLSWKAGPRTGMYVYIWSVGWYMQYRSADGVKGWHLSLSQLYCLVDCIDILAEVWWEMETWWWISCTNCKQSIYNSNRSKLCSKWRWHSWKVHVQSISQQFPCMQSSLCVYWFWMDFRRGVAIAHEVLPFFCVWQAKVDLVNSCREN